MDGAEGAKHGDIVRQGGAAAELPAGEARHPGYARALEDILTALENVRGDAELTEYLHGPHVQNARGWVALRRRFFSTSAHRIPERAKSSDKVQPVGPRLRSGRPLPEVSDDDHPRAVRRILMIHLFPVGRGRPRCRTFAAELRATARGDRGTLGGAGYPFPWRSLRQFFDAMPEPCSHAIGDRQAEIGSGEAFRSRGDRLPGVVPGAGTAGSGVSRTPAAAVLKGADVLTISVSRRMWHNASETMKRLLAVPGARHRDGIVVTHHGASLATLISTPRALLSGGRDSLMGVFPPAGVGEHDVARVRISARGGPAARHLPGPDAARGAGRGGRALVGIPGLLAWYCFRGSARAVRALGRLHAGLRVAGVCAFAVFLVALILVGLPATVLVAWLISPVTGRRLGDYVARLAAPTGLAGARAHPPERQRRRFRPCTGTGYGTILTQSRAGNGSCSEAHM